MLFGPVHWQKNAVIILEFKTIEPGPLSASWSAQACELYALWKALVSLKGKDGTIYTDSRYAFGVVHTFGKYGRKEDLLTHREKN